MAAAPNLLDRRLLFVTGKGGVGKTSISSALALLAAGHGKRTLLCEIDGKGDLARAFETDPVAYKPRAVAPNLAAMAMNTEESLKEYLKQLRIPLVGRIGPLARTFDFVATAAPGVREILTVGKLAFEVREDHFDVVVVDAVATGHVVSQLASPQAIRDVVHVGVVRSQVEWILEILQNPQQTGAVIVTTPEEMPVNETIDLVGRLDSEAHVDLAAVVVNQVLPELFSEREERIFEQLRRPAKLAALRARVGDGAVAVFDAAALAVERRRARAEHLHRLLDALPPGVEPLFVPFIFARQRGVRALRQLAESLGAELGVEP